MAEDPAAFNELSEAISNTISGETSRIIGDPLSTECIDFPSISDIQDIFPSFDSLHDAMTGAFKIPAEMLAELGACFPPTNLIPKIPNMPSVPSMECMFGSIQAPSMAGAYAAVGILSGQLLNVLKTILDKLKIFISLIPLPKFPTFDFDLTDLLAMNPVAIIKKVISKAMDQLESQILDAVGGAIEKYKEVRAAIEGQVELFMDVYKTYSGSLKEFWEKLKLDGLPPLMPPIFVGFDVPIVEAITAVMGMGIAYIGLLMKNVIDNVKRFLKYLDDLEIDYPSFPSLPEIPSFSDILDTIKGELGKMAAAAQAAAGELVDEANSFFQEKLKQTTELIDNMKTQIVEFGMAEIDKFMAMFSEAAGNLRSIIDAIRNLKIPGFPDIKLPSPLFPTLDRPLMEMVYSYYAIVLQMFSAVIKKITDYVKSLPLVGDLLAAALPKIKDWLGAIPSIPSICGSGVQQGMESAISSAKDGIQGTVDGAAGGLESFSTTPIFNMGQMCATPVVDLEGAKAKLESLAGSACSSLNQGIGGLAGGLQGKISDKIAGLGDSAGGAIDGLSDDVASTVGGINDATQGAADSISSGLTSLNDAAIVANSGSSTV